MKPTGLRFNRLDMIRVLKENRAAALKLRLAKAKEDQKKEIKELERRLAEVRALTGEYSPDEVYAHGTPRVAEFDAAIRLLELATNEEIPQSMVDFRRLL